MRRATASCVLIIIAFAGCKRRAEQNPSEVGRLDQRPIATAIEKLGDAPSRIVLYSLNPSNNHSEDLNTDAVFHGYDILGRSDISDRAEQQRLLVALARGAREKKDAVIGLCFIPRHGLHIERDGLSIDFTICFHCLQVEARGFDNIGSFPITKSPEPTFDESIQRHHLKAAPKANEDRGLTKQ